MDGDEPLKPPKIPTKDLNRAFTAPMQPSKPFIQPSPSPAAREPYKAHTEQRRATKPHSSPLADAKRMYAILDHTSPRIWFVCPAPQVVKYQFSDAIIEPRRSRSVSIATTTGAGSAVHCPWK
jgi:hypothetical protein